jgi:hypothetical protein
MDTPSLPRPDLLAHREALRLPASKVVETLVEIIGRKLTAYIGGAESRLRFAFQVARAISEHDSSAVVQAWLTGVNPELEDRVPLLLMREKEIDVVAPAILSAARAFLAGG